MNFGPAAYVAETENYAEKEKERLSTEQSEVEKFCDTMTVADHAKILEIVLRGHVGAKYIRVTYNPPYYNNSRNRFEITHGLFYSNLAKAGWRVEPNDELKGVTVSNIYFDLEKDSDYDEYSYRRFEVKGDDIEIGFWTHPDYTDQKSIETLMLFKDYIRVQLWELIVDKSRICINK